MTIAEKVKALNELIQYIKESLAKLYANNGEDIISENIPSEEIGTFIEEANNIPLQKYLQGDIEDLVIPENTSHIFDANYILRFQKKLKKLYVPAGCKLNNSYISLPDGFENNLDIVIEDAESLLGLAYIANSEYWESEVEEPTDNKLTIKNGYIPSAFYGISNYSWSNTGTQLSTLVLGDIKSIPDYCFSNHSGRLDNLTNIIFLDNFDPDYIGYNVFEGTPWLNNLNTSDHVVYLGKIAFRYTGTKDTIVIRNGTKAIAPRFLANNENVKKIVIPPSVTEIGSEAFYNCSLDRWDGISLSGNITRVSGMNTFNGSGLFDSGMCYIDKVLYRCNGTCPTTLNIDNGIVSISDNCFRQSRSPVILNIPASIENIEYGAFSNNSNVPSTNIKAVNVDPNNEYYSSVDGVLYNKDKTKLIYYPYNKEDELFVVPDSVVEISCSAFTDCNLRKLEIPSTVRKFGENNCGINLPNHLEYLKLSITSELDNYFDTYIDFSTHVNTDKSDPNKYGSYLPFRASGEVLNIINRTVDMLELGNNFDCNIDLSSVASCSQEVVVGWLNALSDRTDKSTYRIKLSYENFNKLSEEDIDIATNKNWTVYVGDY